MKALAALLLSLLASSCAVNPMHAAANFSGSQKKEYAYKDMTGEYTVVREVKTAKNMLVTRHTLYSALGDSEPLEKTVAVSQMGYLAGKPSLRPSIAQHTVWFEKQRYFTQLKVDPASRKLVVTMESPEEKWNGSQSISFPKGGIFCFYSQLPVCLKFHLLLKKDNKKHPVMVIWDSYPYHGEQFRNLSEGPFQNAMVSVDREDPAGKEVGVNLGNQIILLHYNGKNDFEKMFWIAQGIVMRANQEPALER